MSLSLNLQEQWRRVWGDFWEQERRSVVLMLLFLIVGKFTLLNIYKRIMFPFSDNTDWINFKTCVRSIHQTMCILKTITKVQKFNIKSNWKLFLKTQNKTFIIVRLTCKSKDKGSDNCLSKSIYMYLTALGTVNYTFCIIT